MKNLLYVVLFLTFTLSSQGKEIAISFDDCPSGSSHFQSGEERTRKLIEGLNESGVKQAIFFCNSRRVVEGGTNKKRLIQLSDAGHIVGNHTHSHLNLDVVGSELFIEDIKLAEKHLKSIPRYQKFFRYPYLNSGKTLKERAEVLAALNQMGYRHGYVTVDNYDWYMDSLFRDALREKKKIDYKKLGEFYVKYLIESVEFYDEMALKVVGKSPKHVLLLHENDLASLYIKDFIMALKTKGWRVIPAEDAYTDEFTIPDPEIVMGQSRIVRVAKAKGYQGKLKHELENEVSWFGLLEKLKIIK